MEVILMSELIFLVEEASEGGYTARSVGASIFTEGDTLDELRKNVREAVDCHFENGDAPTVVRLHIVHEEILPA
jgi:predicted RNase H-like HicB family nuclease